MSKANDIEYRISFRVPVDDLPTDLKTAVGELAAAIRTIDWLSGVKGVEIEPLDAPSIERELAQLWAAATEDTRRELLGKLVGPPALDQGASP